MSKLKVLLLALATIAMPQFASAAPAADDAMKPYREALHGDLRQFYADRLVLTDKEAKKFWPLFGEYTDKRKQLDDRLFMLLQQYANLYKQGPLSDRKAKPLLKEAREIEEESWKLHDKYMEKAKKVLSPFKASKFFQIDHRIRTAANYERALQVPLIN
jgi:Spy/CpxP family protein refolding chaperone